ncbi:MAG: glycosyltransferase [Paludibacteraceae bacterium]|nr:glycosyltransferase [Paludibacteraceae bacterium]
MNKLYIADVGSFVHNGRSTGHYIPLAQNYIDVLSGAFDVIVAGGPSYRESFHGEQFLELPYDTQGTGWKDRIHLFKNCIKLFKSAKGECIVLQQSSIVTAFIGIGLFFRKKSKLFVIEYSSSSINSSIKRLFYKLAKNKIDGILCPNEEVGKAFGRPYCVIPDYIYAGITNTTVVPYDEKKYDLCIVGRIAPEKGSAEVARKYANSNIRLLIAGRPQSKELGDELKTVCKGSSNIDLRLGFIEREDYERYFRESRYSILNYQREYSIRSSGVVFDTLFNGVPVIGKRCKALQFIEDYGCGKLYDCIEDFDIEEFLSQDMFKQFIENIEAYKTSHVQYKKTLESFIKN